MRSRNFTTNVMMWCCLTAFVLTLGPTLQAWGQASEAHPAEPAKGAAQSAAQGEHGAKPAGEAKEPENEHTKLTQSDSVKYLGKLLGLEPKQASLVFFIFNFLILVGAGWYLAKSGVPKMFKDRSAAIQRGMEEAKRASAESAARLTEVEARLSRLDEEITNMRDQAEKEAKTEEERLRVGTEDEKRKIVQSAEQEIAAASTAARRELKVFAAELAIGLAEKQISVSEDTDKGLVRDFASGLTGKGGR